VSALIRWDRREDEERYRGLIQSIESGMCAVFIGAGLSYNAGFPSWKELLERLSALARRWSGKEILHGNDYYNWAEECRAALGEKEYRRFLVEQFGPEAGLVQTTPAYQHLDRVPFTAFVTTNYDACLMNASRLNGVQRPLHTYPKLPAAYLRSEEPHLFHLHGIIHPERPNITANFIILARSDYDQAYNQEDEIASFLYQLITNFDLLFIGFSLEDSFFMDLLERIWGTYRIRRRRLEDRGAMLPQRRRYAILPVPEKIARPADPIEERGLKSRVEDEDSSLNERYGIKVLRYWPRTVSHRGLEDIIVDIRNRTSKEPLLPAPAISDFELDGEILA